MSNILFVNTKRRLTKEEIKKQMMNQKPLISDEDAFLRHLIWKWSK